MLFCLNRSKPKIAFFILTLATLTALISAQEIGEKFLKEVTVNGDTVNTWVKLESFTEYDIRGNTIYSYSSMWDIERWYIYDANGNMIHARDSNNFETWYEYNPDGKDIYSKNTNGFETWSEYDTYGNHIHYKDSAGIENW